MCVCVGASTCGLCVCVGLSQARAFVILTTCLGSSNAGNVLVGAVVDSMPDCSIYSAKEVCDGG